MRKSLFGLVVGYSPLPIFLGHDGHSLTTVRIATNCRPDGPIRGIRMSPHDRTVHSINGMGLKLLGKWLMSAISLGHYE